MCTCACLTFSASSCYTCRSLPQWSQRRPLLVHSIAHVMLSVWVCLYVWVCLIIPPRAPVVVQCYVLASSKCQGQRTVPLKSAQTSHHTIVLISCTTELQKNSAWRKEGAKPCGGFLRGISFTRMFQSNRNYSTSSWETKSSAQGRVKGGSLYHVYLTQPWQWCERMRLQT